MHWGGRGSALSRSRRARRSRGLLARPRKRRVGTPRTRTAEARAAPPPLRPCTSLPSSVLATLFSPILRRWFSSEARRLFEQVALEPAPDGSLSASRKISPILLKALVATFECQKSPPKSAVARLVLPRCARESRSPNVRMSAVENVLDRAAAFAALRKSKGGARPSLGTGAQDETASASFLGEKRLEHERSRSSAVDESTLRTSK